MDKLMANTFEKQLCDIVDEYELVANQRKYDEFKLIDLQTRCVAAIERIVGRNSVYFDRIKRIDELRNRVHYKLPAQVAVARALLFDIRGGYLESFEQIIRGDLFADYLEMAVHLEENGYKDPAAVLAGSTLEAHLRKLCDRHEIVSVSDGGKPKKADTLNADLQKAGVYNKLDQKNITAWLDIRNKSAHGKYDEYTREQVRILIDSVRDFINRHPA